jgi:hypothetical protein
MKALSNVTKFPEVKPARLDLKNHVVSLASLSIGGKRITKAIFSQIPTVVLKEWPRQHDVFGWVSQGTPWLLWTHQGRLVRSNIRDWHVTHSDGTEEPITNYERQLYIL